MEQTVEPSRLQRFAQRLSNLIGLLPTALTVEPRPDPLVVAAVAELRQINANLQTIADLLRAR